MLILSTMVVHLIKKDKQLINFIKIIKTIISIINQATGLPPNWN